MDRRISSKMLRFGMLESYKPSNQTGQHCCPIVFCSSRVIHHDCNLDYAGYPNYAVCSFYKKYCDNLTNMYFSARWLVRANVHNRDTLVPAEVE